MRSLAAFALLLVPLAAVPAQGLRRDAKGQLVTPSPETPVVQATQRGIPTAQPAGWQRSPVAPRWWFWYEGGKLKAGYFPDTDYYAIWDPIKGDWQKSAAPWGKRPNFGVEENELGKALKMLPPVPAPSKKHESPEAVQQAPVVNFGVDERPLQIGEDSYVLNGKAVTRDKALAAVEGKMIEAGLADDSGKMRLTIIGSDAERKQVLGDLERQPLSDYREQLLVQAYAPDHWAVKQAGFDVGGHPSIYLQAPSGQVIHRQADYVGGALALAQALRVADPNYTPTKDPDLRKPHAGPASLKEIPMWAWALAGGGVLWLVMRGKGQQTPQSPPLVAPTAVYQPAAPQQPDAPEEPLPDWSLSKLLQAEVQMKRYREEKVAREQSEQAALAQALRELSGSSSAPTVAAVLTPAATPEKK